MDPTTQSILLVTFGFVVGILTFLPDPFTYEKDNREICPASRRGTPLGDPRGLHPTTRLAPLPSYPMSQDRLLKEGEILKAGDYYGESHNFKFVIGTPQVEDPQPGDPCPIGLITYKIRRPKENE